MHDRYDPASDPPLNAPDVPLEEKAAELEGDEGRDNQTVYISEGQIDEVGGLRERDIPIYEGELEAEGGGYEVAHLESLTDSELREGETDDPNVAAEEGLTYVAPIDPPVYPGADVEGADVASGFGVSSQAEPYDADHHDELLYAEDEMTARVRDALRADASTSAIADRIEIDTEGGIVTLRGVVDDVNDTDSAAAVAEEVEGVTEVRDQLQVRGL